MYHGGLNRAIGQYNQVRTEASVFDVDAHRLVGMLLDGAIEKLLTAKRHMEHGNIAEKGRYLGAANAIILGLRSSLEMSAGGAIAQNLSALYLYMNERLALANLENDSAIVDEVIALLRPIRDGWNAIPVEVRQRHAQQHSVAAVG